MKLRQISFKLVSLVMTFAILFSVCATTINAIAIADFGTEDESFDYVSIGASNTNGYGHLGYLPGDVTEDPLAASKAELNDYGYNRAPANAYPALIRDALAKQLGTEVSLRQLAISSMRVEEVRVLLDDSFDGDAYTDWRFYDNDPTLYTREAWFVTAGEEILKAQGVDPKDITDEMAYKALVKDYKDAVKNAELITLDMGWNNFGVYAFNNIKTILDRGYCYYEPDFSLLEDAIEEQKYYEIKAAALDYLKGQVSFGGPELMEKLDLIADVLAYTTIGACYHFDVILEKIYKLNPDAQVVVLNIQNLADDLVVDLEGETLELGDIYGELIALVDDYRRSESPYADRFMFANAGDVETFLDEIKAWDGDPSTLGGDMKDCFDMYDDDLYVRTIVEYLMVGQALSGLFKGFRDMAANYGLDAFNDDGKYTYEFALTRSIDQLLSLDLAKLDLNNPAGSDKDVELYGAALVKHLKNLRGASANVAAYDYVFEALLASLEGRKSEVVDGLSQIFAGVNDYVNGLAGFNPGFNVDGYYKVLSGNADATVTEATIADFTAKFYADFSGTKEYLKAYLNSTPVGEIAGMILAESKVFAGLVKAANGYAEIAQGIEYIVPMAKAEFESKLRAIHKTYKNTLNYAYDVVATFCQYAANIDSIEISADSFAGFNDVADGLMGIIFDSFIGGAQQKFYYELQKNGVQDTGVTEDPVFVLDETKFEDPAIQAIAVLAVRYELGNSFFAHPNVAGHKQVADAVLLAYARGTSAKEDSEGDFLRPWSWLLGYVQTNYPEAYDVLCDVAVYVGSEEFKAIAADLEKLYDLVESATTPEEKARLAKNTYELVNRLLDVAAKATNKSLDLSEIEYYVSLGDSTINGYGLDGYVDNMQNGVEQVVAGSAHVLLAQMIFGENWKSQFGNFCQGSLRADDLLLFLGGDVELDDYYYAEIEPNLMEGTLEATQEKFIANVASADLISLAIGGGNFLTFAGKYVNRVMGTTPGGAYELDWARVGIEPDSLDMKQLQKDLDALVALIDTMELLDQYLPEGMDVEDPAKLTRALAEGLIYGYVSYTYYYMECVERIREINPDAHILILGMFNPVDAWTMSVPVNGEEIEINVGALVGLLLESANTLPLAAALQDENITYVSTRDAETILESEKRGEELGFKDFYNSSFQSNGKAVHASNDGHKYIADQMYDSITVEYTDAEIAEMAIEAFADYAKYIEGEFGDEGREALKEAIDELVTFIEENYDEAYEYAHTELRNNGTIAEINAAIDDAMKAIDAARAEVEAYEVIESLTEAKATLLKELALTQATLMQIKILVNYETISEENLETLEILVMQLEDHLANVGALSAQVGGVALGQVKVVLDYAYAQTLAALELAQEFTIEFLKSAYAYIYEKAPVAYEKLVSKLVDSIAYYSHEAAKYAYNWLINNPEKVIELIDTYGDDLVDFIVDNYEIIFGVLGFVGYNYGEDILNLVLDNADVIIPAIVGWFEIHGDLVWDLLVVYFNAIVEYYNLGLDLDFDSLDGFHAIFDRIFVLLGELLDMIKDGVYDYLEALDIMDKINAQLAKLDATLREAVENAIYDLNEYVEAKLEELKAQIEKQIAILTADINAQIAALREQLKTAVGEAREQILRQIAALEAELEARVKALRAELEALANMEIKNTEDAIAALDILLQKGTISLAEFICDQIMAFVDDAIRGEFTPTEDTYYVSVNGGDALYADLLATKLSEKLDRDITLDKTTWGAIDYDMLAKADLVTIGFDQDELTDYAVAQLLGYINDLVDGQIRDDANAYVSSVFTAFEAYYAELQAAAGALGFIMPDFDFASVENGLNGQLNGIVDMLIGESELSPELEALLGEEYFAVAEMANGLLGGKDAEELDWSKFIPESELYRVDELRAELRAELLAQGIVENYTYEINVLDYIFENFESLGLSAAFEYMNPEIVGEKLASVATYTVTVPVVDSLVFAIESFLYSNVEFNYNYGNLILDLYEINPDATVILLGAYNALDYELSFGGESFDLSEAYSYIAKVSSVQPFTYALLSEKVAFVDISDAETWYEYYINNMGLGNGIVDFIAAYLGDSTITDVTVDGHQYIYEQIMGILTVGCDHKYDNACDTTCNKCGYVREVGDHVYVDGVCIHCGHVKPVDPDNPDNPDVPDEPIDPPSPPVVEPEHVHTYDDCYDATCNGCGESREVIGHVFDNCEDTTCYRCSHVREPLTHIYDDCNDATCNHCGMTRPVYGHNFNNACDATCNACDATREVEGHVYSGCTDASCNVCGELREVSAHVVDNCADNICNVCGQNVAVNGHKFGEWTVTVQPSRKAEGQKTRTCSGCGLVETKAIAPLQGMSAGAITGVVTGSVVVAGAAGFAIYWFLLQKKTFAELLALLGVKTAEKAAEGEAAQAAAEATEAIAEAATEEAAEATTEATTEAATEEATEAATEETVAE